MIILRLNGGLGNQMFQYAFCRFLSHKYHQKICIDFSQFKDSDRSYSLDMFPLNPELIVDLNELGDIENYSALNLHEESLRFEINALDALDECDLENGLFLVSGYWQSHRYFETINQLILGDFGIAYKVGLNYQHILQLLLESESVMVHIRRGDYLWPGNLNKHGVVSIEYILQGMAYFREKIKNVNFFIFSDDSEWCKSNIVKSDDVIFVDKDHDEGKTSFTLMRQCKYFLISNSTYSWWTAWLSEYPNKEVICPKIWFRDNSVDSPDLIPEDWIKY